MGRTRLFFLVTYLTEDQIKLVIKMHCQNIAHYSYAYHDKDDCEPHTHIILCLNNATTETAVLKWFKGGIDWQNTFIEIGYDIVGCFEYLTHENDKDKYHYSRDIIKSNDIAYFNDLVSRGCVENVSIRIINDILNNVPFRELAVRYGREIIINFKRYYDFANKIYIEENPRSNYRLLDNETGETFLKFEQVKFDDFDF